MTTKRREAETEVARLICNGLDAERAELAEIVSLHRSGEEVAAACALVRHLRARGRPVLPVACEAVMRQRARASEADRLQAQRRIGQRLADASLTNGAHTITFTAMGEQTLFVGADEALCLRLAERAFDARDTEWGGHEWGHTRSLCQFIARLFAIPECPDRALLPFFGWLLTHSAAEWQWARTWSETMLGNAGHNWWLHTYLGFFEAGLYFPEFRCFQKFRAFAPEYFEHEMRNLIASDGFTRERSGYHWGTANLFYDYLHTAEANGIAVSGSFRARLRQMVQAHWQLLSPNGDVPRFGDVGNGHQAGTGMDRLRELAAWIGVPEAKFVAESLTPEQPRPKGLPLWGRDWAEAYTRLEAAPPQGSAADAALPETGYYVMRRDWTPTSDWLCLDAGSTGSIVTSHTHTHIFHFELYARGRAALIDNCSGPYGTSPERMWREGSASHNVATVDGADHVPILNEWRWAAEVTPVVNDWRSEPGFAYFSGAHEGYIHLPEPIASSRRKLFYLRGGYWILIDRFTPSTGAEHLYEQHFHVGLPHILSKDGRLLTSGAGGNLAIIPIAGACGTATIAPCDYPLEHYDNPAHLRYTHRVAGPALFVTLLVPFLDGRAPEVEAELLRVEADDRIVTPWEITALSVSVNGRRDLYVDQHMQWNLEWRAGGQSGNRRLFHSRTVC